MQFIRLGIIFFLGRETVLLEKIDKLCDPQTYPQISNRDEEAAAFYLSFMFGSHKTWQIRNLDVFLSTGYTDFSPDCTC